VFLVLVVGLLAGRAQGATGPASAPAPDAPPPCAPTSLPPTPAPPTSPVPPLPEPPKPVVDDTAPADPAAATYSSQVTRLRQPRPAELERRAGSEVLLRQLRARLPRSAPEALAYEPGVYVQQTASSQGSPYVRGLTGQQVGLFFDGVRLNNSLFRQGPNQYFFTIDPRVLRSVEVVRGGASVLRGSDALGGAIEVHPLEPPPAPRGVGWSAITSLLARGGTADGEAGARAQLGLSHARGFGLLGGVGLRRAGLVESGGALRDTTGQQARVPALAADGRTQLGTGYEELTGDLRLVLDLGHGQHLTAASYLYRQYDAPRTDRCPPWEAQARECLWYDEQFRTLAYLAWEGERPAGRLLRSWRSTLSFQRQHERRHLTRPLSFTENGGRDDVNTLGLAWRGDSRPFDLGFATLRLTAGLDGYQDTVDSTVWTGFTDLDIYRFDTRGQYVAGSRYSTGGLFARGELVLGERLSLRGGGRLARAAADAPADLASGSLAVDAAWTAVVGELGLRYQPWRPLSVLLNVDGGFRAPNLDDLTARQQTGPGYQIENPDLQPERSTTLEAGVRLDRSRLSGELWIFRTLLEDAITREQASIASCPGGIAGAVCRDNRNHLRLVNAGERAVVQGLEGSLRASLPAGLLLESTLSYAWGEGPAVGSGSTGEERVPLSRVPPLHGTVELTWRSDVRRLVGLQLGGGLRWADRQDRLAPTDLADPRIPLGGTPGYLVADLRAGWEVASWFRWALVLENLTDEIYRTHGSSINGPGRSLLLEIAATL